MSVMFSSPGSFRGVTVGIDIGTTAVKAIAVDEDGRVLHRRRRPHVFCSPAPGLAEHAAAGDLPIWTTLPAPRAHHSRRN